MDHIPYVPSSQRWAPSSAWICGSKVQRSERWMKSIPPQWIRSPQWLACWVDWRFRTLHMGIPIQRNIQTGRFKTGSSKIPCTPTKINSIDSIDTWNLKKIKANLETNLFQGPKMSKINLLGCMTWHLWNHNIYLLVMWEPQTQTQSYQSGRKNARNHCAHKVVISKYMEYGIGHPELAKKRRFFCFINPLWCIFGMVMHFDHTHISIEITTAIQNRSKQLHRSQG